jgi:hypothetical protein
MNRRKFLSFAGLTAGAAALTGALMPARNPYYTGPVSDHFDGTRFFVPGREASDKGLTDLLKWRFSEKPADWPPLAPAAQDRPPARVEGADVRISYVGHASLLIQTHGVNLLVDPVWAERASPVSFAGPKRVNAPGIALEDLPPLDAVLVSHNHYDHLDTAALAWLARRGHVSPVQLLASERLRADFHHAQLGPRVTMRWDPLPAAARGQGGPPDLSGGQIAAKRRFEAAVAACGPGLSDIAWRVICQGEGLEAAADKALALGTGARGLRSVLEGVLLETMYALPEATPGSKFTVTAEAIRGEKPVTVSAASPKKKAS